MELPAPEEQTPWFVFGWLLEILPRVPGRWQPAEAAASLLCGQERPQPRQQLRGSRAGRSTATHDGATGPGACLGQGV